MDGRKPKTTIPIIEFFGPTIQGEGMVVGQKTMFVRTGGCDFRCAWCDSKYSWDGSVTPIQMEPQELLDKVEALAPNNFQWITLTGGNPALQGAPMGEFIKLGKEKGYKFALETQGSRWQPWFVDCDAVTLSPKPPSSKMHNNQKMLDLIIGNLDAEHINYSLKIVIFDDADFEYARGVFERYPEAQHFLSVGNADSDEEGDISGRLLKKLGWLFDKVIADPGFNDVRVLPQLHTLVWYNKRGV